MNVISIVIAENLQLFRSGLVALLANEPDISVVETVESRSKLAAAVRHSQPRVALIDIDLAGEESAGDPSARDGIAAAGAVLAQAPACRVVIMAERRRPGDLRRAVAAGAAGFVMKDISPAELADAVRRVARDEQVIDAALAFAEIGAARSPLTPRELEVLRAAAQGGTVTEIAGELYLSSGTVRNYLARALTKMGARTRVEAVSKAREHGWL
nr:response regulator transcription factor [Actinomadura parmotrematis]